MRPQSNDILVMGAVVGVLIAILVAKLGLHEQLFALIPW